MDISDLKDGDNVLQFQTCEEGCCATIFIQATGGPEKRKLTLSDLFAGFAQLQIQLVAAKDKGTLKIEWERKAQPGEKKATGAYFGEGLPQ